MSSSPSRPTLPPLRSQPPTGARQTPVLKVPKKRKQTHVPPPPIPQWALASRPAAPVAVQTLSSRPAQRQVGATGTGLSGGPWKEEEIHATTDKPPILPPPQATEEASLRTPSGPAYTARPTALVASSPSRATLRDNRTPGPEILPATAPVQFPGKDNRGPQRGRPKGSRKRTNAPADLLERPRPKRVEARPDYRVRKKRGQHSKNPAKPSSSPSSPRDVYDKLEPSFVQFLCEWGGCRAELDSFVKLKKHIVVAHGEEVRETKRCKWGKCSHLDEDADVDAAPIIFASVEDLLSHATSHHLDPILWHMGDGRHGHGIVTKDSPVEYATYLFWNGCQATPSIRHQKVETLADLRERQRRLRKILDQAYANAPTVAESDLEGFAEEEPFPSALS